MKILIFFLILSFPIFAYESDGNHLDCNTIKEPTDTLFDPVETKITFYGDSRTDLVNNGGIYGSSRMERILNIQPDGNLYLETEKFTEKNIQNFGVNGFTSRNILDHLIKCLNSEIMNYKVGRRFV
jgi:hypothetical protein